LLATLEWLRECHITEPGQVPVFENFCKDF